MGLLDDLKKQADQVKTQQLSQQSLRAESLRVVEEQMKQSFLYLNDLLKQLAVLKPENPLVFSIPGVGDLKGLRLAESFIDYRKKRIDDKEYFDTTSFFIRWQGPENLTVERDMPGTIQKIRDALWHYKVKFTEDEVKGARGTVEKTRFNIPSAIVTDVVIKAGHEEGKLLVAAKNLMRLGPDDFSIPAIDLSEGLLEDFARALLGDAANLRKYRVASVGI